MPAGPFNPQDAAAQRDLRLLAEHAARLGGRLARSYFGQPFEIRLKPDHSEVSEADEATQAALVRELRAVRPTDAFLTEEVQPAAADAPPPPANDRLCWVIDPIDGTRNFVRGIPLYACSVAAMYAGFPLAGAICDPHQDRLWSANAAEGLFVDGAPASRRPAPAVAGVRLNAVVAIPSQPVGRAAAIAQDWLHRLVCRNLGSTALHMAWLATGELDAMLADIPRLWDIAAGWLMLTVTGIVAATPSGDPLFPIDVGTYHGEKLPMIAGRSDLLDRLIPAG